MQALPKRTHIHSVSAGDKSRPKGGNGTARSPRWSTLGYSLGRSVRVRTFSFTVLGSLIAAPVAWAQPRERPSDGALAPPRCSVVQSRSLSRSAEVPDGNVAPAAVSTSEGVLVTWRSTTGGLYLSRLGPTLERLRDDRELARPAGPFAMVNSTGGAAVAMVEHTRRGEAVLLARLSPDGEARNVPRELGHGEQIDNVALAWTGTGYVIAWGSRGSHPGTYVVSTDVRGVPRGPVRRVLDATAPRVAWLPSAQVAVLTVTGNEGIPVLALLDEEGVVTGTSRWPAGARVMVPALNGSGALGLTMPSDPLGGFVGLVRWSLVGGVSEGPVALRVTGGAVVSTVVPDRSGLVAAIDEPNGRESIVRIGFDGSVTVLAVRAGALGTVVPVPETGFLVVSHESLPGGSRQLSLVQMVCPRAPVVTLGSAGTQQTQTQTQTPSMVGSGAVGGSGDASVTSADGGH